MGNTKAQANNGQLTHSVPGTLNNYVLATRFRHSYMLENHTFLGLHPLDIPKLDVGHIDFFSYRLGYAERLIDDYIVGRSPSFLDDIGCFINSLGLTIKPMSWLEKKLSEIPPGVYGFAYFMHLSEQMLYPQGEDSSDLKTIVASFLKKCDKAYVHVGAQIVWVI